MSSILGAGGHETLERRRPPGTRTWVPPDAAETVLPLVVDLDGTLTPTDTLFEASLQLIKSSPWTAPLMLSWLLTRGRAGLKRAVAERVTLNAAALPYERDLCDWLRSERAKGRKIYLATAADERVAQSVSEHLGLFDGVIASDGRTNNKGARKLDAITRLVGRDFVYVGDGAADLPVWRAAGRAVLVGVSGATKARLGSEVRIEREFGRKSLGLLGWLRAIRLHQWLKNLLVFVPLLTAFSFGAAPLAAAAMAFLCFGMVASATYLLNDLADVASDRRHPRKRHRALASGALQIPAALGSALLLLICGFVLSARLPAVFALWLGVYLVLTTAYSWHLKRFVIVDVVTLAGLYTLRILAGAAATGVTVSFWLLAFSASLFLSLALVKRCAELVLLENVGVGQASGRDYGRRDMPVLVPFGVGAGLASVVVFMLFLREAELAGRYASPHLLWLVAPLLVYWILRLWIKTGRGEMRDDPLVYALMDRGSRVVVALILGMTLLAHFVHVRLV